MKVSILVDCSSTHGEGLLGACKTANKSYKRDKSACFIRLTKLPAFQYSSLCAIFKTNFYRTPTTCQAHFSLMNPYPEESILSISKLQLVRPQWVPLISKVCRYTKKLMLVLAHHVSTTVYSTLHYLCNKSHTYL